jgi:hypothetical protein
MYTDLALLENPVNFPPSSRGTLELETCLLKTRAKSIGSFPSVVVRDFAGDVVKDMGLRDAVGSMSTKPTHNRATATQEVAVQSGQSTTGEGELRGAVVGEKWVGVLEERDEDKPVVDP